MSPPGVEPVLPTWKVGVVTASPPSRTSTTVLPRSTNTTVNNCVSCK